MPLVIEGHRTLVPCRLDASEVPLIIQDIKYADFRDGFEAGMSAILGALTVREKVREHKLLIEKYDKTVSVLNQPELVELAGLPNGQTFDSQSELMEYGDGPRTDDEEAFLKKLAKLGVLDQIRSCRGPWYKLSADGEKIRDRLKERRNN